MSRPKTIRCIIILSIDPTGAETAGGFLKMTGNRGRPRNRTRTTGKTLKSDLSNKENQSTAVTAGQKRIEGKGEKIAQSRRSTAAGRKRDGSGNVLSAGG